MTSEPWCCSLFAPSLGNLPDHLICTHRPDPLTSPNRQCRPRIDTCDSRQAAARRGKSLAWKVCCIKPAESSQTRKQRISSVERSLDKVPVSLWLELVRSVAFVSVTDLGFHRPSGLIRRRGSISSYYTISSWFVAVLRRASPRSHGWLMLLSHIWDREPCPSISCGNR